MIGINDMIRGILSTQLYVLKKIIYKQQEVPKTFIFLQSVLPLNLDFRMSEEYTNDGFHLTGNGYLRWAECNKILC